MWKPCALVIVILSICSCGANESTDESTDEGTDAAKDLQNPRLGSSEARKRAVEISVEAIEITATATESGTTFTNRSPGSVWYDGYQPDLPIYDLQGQLPKATLEHDKWKSYLFWCGTGLESIELAKGDSLVINPSLSYITDPVTVSRIRMHFYPAIGSPGITVLGPESNTKQ